MLKVIDWIMKMSGDLRKNHIGAFSAQASLLHYLIICSLCHAFNDLIKIPANQRRYAGSNLF